MNTVRFITYGCKANQYDTQVLRESLVRRGLLEQQRGADLVVVNTCTVTAEAGRKARQKIRRLVREDPKVKICVTGCLAESEADVLRELPGVEWVLGNGDAKRPANFLRQLGFDAQPEELGIPSGITAFAGHTRAFVKIQDGCDKACAFCIIPKTRGKSQSRPIPELVREVRNLVESGHLEVVLCGIHIGHWGLDIDATLADLMHALVAIDARDDAGNSLDFRLRLSSIEATEVDDSLIGLMAERPDRIAPHLHMPMQSGDDEVLARMNRWYTTREYLAACDSIRARVDRPAFTADILVGFPGEGERQFQNTLDTVDRAGFARVHVFPFSPRPGTAAWTMGDRPAPEAVRERRAQLSERTHAIGEQFRRSLAGVQEWVVLEGTAGLSGRYQRVRIDLDDYPGALPAAARLTLEVHEDLSLPLADRTVELIGRPTDDMAVVR
ncbi:MAG: threonylcarbamoyladenosine tRNA methylthiotransferase MtaB [Chlamydiales bacterium]